MRCRFLHWEKPEELNPKREINILSDTELFAYYEVIEMGTVTCSGVVSVQDEEGEIVTVTVTKPDNTTEQVSTITDAEGAYSVDFDGEPGDYSAKARVEADMLYEAAESSSVSFSIGKMPRTITLNVNES